MTFGTLRWWGRQTHAPAAFTPRKCSRYSFSLGAESTPGPWYGRKEYVTEKSSDTTGNRSRDLRLVALPYIQAVKYECPIFMYMSVFVSKSCMSYKYSMYDYRQIITTVRRAITSSNRKVLTVTALEIPLSRLKPDASVSSCLIYYCCEK